MDWSEIDKALDSMTPEELRSFESEVDKRASETSTAYVRALGSKLARSTAEALKGGQDDPIAHIIKAASEPIGKDVKEAFEAVCSGEMRVAEFMKLTNPRLVDRILDGCSEEKAAAFEASLDREAEGAKYAAHYYEIGRAMAGATKTAARPAAALPFLEALSKGINRSPVGAAVKKQFGYRAGSWMSHHPIATGAIGLGAGYVGTRVLDRD